MVDGVRHHGMMNRVYTGCRWLRVAAIIVLLVSIGVDAEEVGAADRTHPVRIGAPVSIASSDTYAIAHGKRLFAQNCRPCHGKEAVGENPASPMGGWHPQAGPVAPALNGTGHAWHHPPEYLFGIVRNGSTVKGSRMQGWAGAMNDYDILAVIAYVQSLWPARIQEAYRHRHLHRVRQ